VTAALESLPWVEQGSVRIDLKLGQAEFAVKDRSAFNLAEVRKAIARRGFAVSKVVSGP
jgi:hypothetical protein